VTSLGVMTAVEVVDGFSKKILLQHGGRGGQRGGCHVRRPCGKVSCIDALLDFRLLYQQSADARQVGETDPLADYSGQMFLLAVKADGIPRLREVPVVGYLELQVGYNTQGYEPNDGTMNDPHRRIYYGIGINLSRLLSDTVFRGTSRAGRSSAERTRSLSTSRSLDGGANVPPAVSRSAGTLSSQTAGIALTAL